MTFLVRATLQRPYTFAVISLLIALLGLGSIATIPPDIFPAINIPVASVITHNGFGGNVSRDVLPLSRCALFGNRDGNRIRH
jgi:hypothetical protein